MPDTPPRIDEYTLSALLSGTLSDQEHREALRLLAEDEAAQELVAMASIALGAEASPPTDRGAAADRAARPARQRRRVFWTAASTLAILFAFSLGILVERPAVTETTSEVRTLRTQAGERLVPVISTSTLELTWKAVEDAYSYDVQVWDADRAELVGETVTKTNALKDTDVFVQELSEKLEAGRTYSLHLYATDAENRRIVESVPTDFIYQPR